MADRIHIDPAELRQAAEEHRRTAELLGDVPATHGEIMASLDSLGPVFAELREAGRQLLEHRRTCYLQQAAAHGDLADALVAAADSWEQHDAEAAHQMRQVR